MVKTWKTRDGRKLPINTLSDDHLKRILHMGLRAIARRRMTEALDNLADAYQGDEGAEYLGDVQFEGDILQARSMPALREALKASPRFAPLWAEAKSRGLVERTRVAV